MPIFLKDSQKILSLYTDGIEKYENELPDHIYCLQVNTDIYGVSGRVLLFYDPWNHINLCNEMSERISNLKSELAVLKRYPKSRLGRYTQYFTITKHKNDNGFDYSVNTEKVDELRRKKGFFLLFSTDMESESSDILYYYRAKDSDEKLFSQIKVDMDGNRIRTHGAETTDGKTFATFIACVIRAYMLGRLSKYLTEKSTSMKKVFNQLSNITMISSNEGYRFTKALTKKQKEILEKFNAASDILKNINGDMSTLKK